MRRHLRLALWLLTALLHITALATFAHGDDAARIIANRSSDRYRR